MRSISKVSNNPEGAQDTHIKHINLVNFSTNKDTDQTVHQTYLAAWIFHKLKFVCPKSLALRL